ncbi:MAG TPA: hypothetical protein VFG76_07525, partial [Candidatus Polarisedimenticolia bacterium]|nr:hypothetical protein [Candidatus Polarisedimenticolia bacterium]
FTFVLLGSSLIWSGLAVVDGPTALFVLLALLVRPLVLLISLLPAGIDRRSLRLIAWFGPRGLSSLLLVLVPVFAGLPGGSQLFALCSLVVLVSVVLHGGSVTLLGRPGPPATKQPPPESPQRSEKLHTIEKDERIPERLPERISLDEVLALQGRGERVIALDARSHRTFDQSGVTDPESIRLDPERAVQEAEWLGLPKEAWLVAYCA